VKVGATDYLMSSQLASLMLLSGERHSLVRRRTMEVS
jgi:hypothetical protein